MDLESGKQQLIHSLKKCPYLLLVVLIGIVLMLIPQKTQISPNTVPYEEAPETDLETELSEILSQISGVGKTAVLLTEASGRDTIYQMDTGQNRENLDTVIIMNENREEEGLVKQILPPAYKGALIVCEGADSASVRLSVVTAVKSVTGLSSDCITVLKMK